MARVVAGPMVCDGVFEEVRAHLTAREVVEVLQVTGFSWSLGRLCPVLEVELEEAHGTAVIDRMARRVHNRSPTVRR